MKIACFKCSQHKTSPALLRDFLPLACTAQFSFACPVFPQSFRTATRIAAHPSPSIWPGHNSFCLIFLGTSNFSLSFFRGDTLQDVCIYFVSPQPYVWYESWCQIVPIRENRNGQASQNVWDYTGEGGTGRELALFCLDLYLVWQSFSPIKKLVFICCAIWCQFLIFQDFASFSLPVVIYFLSKMKRPILNDLVVKFFQESISICGCMFVCCQVLIGSVLFFS